MGILTSIPQEIINQCEPVELVQDGRLITKKVLYNKAGEEVIISQTSVEIVKEVAKIDEAMTALQSKKDNLLRFEVKVTDEKIEESV